MKQKAEHEFEIPEPSVHYTAPRLAASLLPCVVLSCLQAHGYINALCMSTFSLLGNLN
jgi:hypothetical protein